MSFQKAVVQPHNARVAIFGPSGAGKTHLALHLATALVGGEDAVAMLNTEGERGSHYAGIFKYSIDTATKYGVAEYTASWRAARDAGFKALLIDSLSQFWNGEGGVLELGGDGIKSWDTHKNPAVRKLIGGIHAYPGHVLATLRSATDFVEEEDPRTHKKKFVAVGVKPVFKDGVQYEFDLLLQLEMDHRVTVLKAPPGSELDGWVGDSLDPELTEKLVKWSRGES